MSKSRSFAFTDFLLIKSFYTNEVDDAEYIIIGEEKCPETGRTHWQGFVRFENPRSVKKMRERFNPRHIEKCKASDEKNIKYCEKDGNIILEIGERPEQGKRKDLEEIKQEIESGTSMKEIARNNFGCWLQYGKALMAYRDLQQPERDWKTKVIVLWGPGGTGKTRKAHEAGAKIIEYDGRYFGNYSNEEIVLLDDFDPADMNKSLFLKITDRYPMKVRVLYGYQEWNPKVLYITSNSDPVNWYGGGTEIRRRLDVVEHM